MLNQTDRKRLRVLHQAESRRMTQREAAEELGLSPRWVRKLLARMRAEGDGGILQRLRGRESNRKLGEPVRRQALDLIGAHYADYGPTLAAEVLAAEHSIAVSRETLRGWMSRAGLWKSKKARVKKAHLWRQRRARRGELVQWDTSEHHWLEGRGDKLYLIAMIDDATSELTESFALADSTEENMRLLGDYIARHGRPRALYTDQASLFQVNRPLHHNKYLPAQPGPTQIGRALEELEIERITAHSPQAKGRVERSFGTMQDRLVKGLRRAKAASCTEAQRYLEEVFVAEWNSRWKKEPASATDAHRPLEREQDAASILSRIEERVIGNDYTVSLGGQRYQIPRAVIRPRMRRNRIRLERRLDGRLMGRWEGREAFELALCLERSGEAKPTANRKAKKAGTANAKAEGKAQGLRRGNNGWMDNFSVGDPARERPTKPAAPAALRATSAAGFEP